MATFLVSPGSISLSNPPQIKTGGYFVQTWGCQMNEEDSEQIALSLGSIGLTPVSTWLEAEIIILNTCSVRRKPEDKAYSFLGALLTMKEKNPNLVIGVCGCMAQVKADEIKKRAPHVDFVLGTGQVNDVAGIVEELRQKRRFIKRLELPERKGAIVDDVPQRHIERSAKLKAFVPIQYGCDKFCSFCIVPTTRGRERSRSTQDILEEVTALADRGTKEITLLGQTVNSYGKNLPEGRVPFSELLWKLSEVSGLERIRFTSPYPRDFTDDLIKTIKDCPKVMECVHLPLQSGSDQVLAAMKRLYSRESFREIIGKLREAVPNISLTTDIIVGFPEETDAQFDETLQYMEEIAFDSAYMFIYSIRPGTPAAKMTQVPKPVKHERFERLLDLQNKITMAKHQALVGTTSEVLIEGVSNKNPDMLYGYGRDAKVVLFKGSPERTGRLAQVRITEAHQSALTGELV